MKRLEAALEPGRGRDAGGGRLRREPLPGQGLHRAEALPRQRRALPGRPQGRHAARPGSPARTRPTTTWWTWSSAATSRPDGTIEAAEVREGDPSPDGKGTLVAARGIEIGHVFQLGRKYADAFGLDALGPDGKPIRITMGSYGVGVSRLVAVIAEQNLRRPRPGVAPRSSRRPTCTWSSPARTTRCGPAPRSWPPSCPPPASQVLLDDRKASAGREVRRRRADRRADHPGGRPRPGQRRGRGQGPAHRRAREIAVDEAVAHLVKLVRA